MAEGAASQCHRKLTALQMTASLAITGAMCSSLSLALKAHLDLPALYVVIIVKREIRLIAFCFWHITKQSLHTHICMTNKLLESVNSDGMLGMLLELVKCSSIIECLNKGPKLVG